MSTITLHYYKKHISVMQEDKLSWSFLWFHTPNTLSLRLSITSYHCWIKPQFCFTPHSWSLLVITLNLFERKENCTVNMMCAELIINYWHRPVICCGISCRMSEPLKYFKLKYEQEYTDVKVLMARVSVPSIQTLRYH